MSASEKLKALDADVGAMSRDVLGGAAEAEWGADWYLRFASLGAALPQIVAVVANAELVSKVTATPMLDAALSALDEALP
jgi:hypothetical protein